MLAQDIRIACLATYEYFGPAGGPAVGAAACGVCRKPGWSSPLSSSKAGPSPRSLRAYGVSKAGSAGSSPATELKGEAAFEPRSRRPRTSPQATDASLVQLILRLRTKLADAGFDAGADTIGWHLQHTHRLTVSRATINRILVPAGTVTAEPSKRPRSSYIRFQAAMPNEGWQSDFTHYRLATGADTGILSWLDDHSRFALSVTAHVRVTGPLVLTVFGKAAGRHGIPAATLTDKRHGLHHPPGRRPRRKDLSRARTTPTARGPEELPTQPHHHLRESGTVPADP